jgi:DtxR family transcriptional regulator, Mn-dependent transcriptional regulator
MSDLIDTTEMYLKVVFELEEQRQPALRARLAERLDQAMPSVSQTVSRLERDGLLRLGDERIVELTDEGRRIAIAVMRKHRVAERFLYDVLGLDWADCHEEACRWEHVLGDAAEEKLAALLTNLEVDPYGNPIPGLERIGRQSSAFVPGRPITDAPSGLEGTVASLGEGIQADEGLLRAFHESGITPGATVSVTPDGSNFVVVGATGSVNLDPHLAAQFFVSS